MAPPVTSKQILQETAEIKKTMATAASQIDTLTKAYEESYKFLGNTHEEIKALLASISEWERAMTSALADMKWAAERTRHISGDIEMKGRRFYEMSDTVSTLQNEVADLHQKLQKKRDDAGLIKKLEVAEKAYEKAGKAFSELAIDWSSLRDLTAVFDPQEIAALAKRTVEIKKDMVELHSQMNKGRSLSKKLDDLAAAARKARA